MLCRGPARAVCPATRKEFHVSDPNNIVTYRIEEGIAWVSFNRPDGKGYDFLADRVLELDAFNPQMAARMLTAFRGWRMLEPKRRAAAKATLQGVARAKPLSNDVFEIVSKMLD